MCMYWIASDTAEESQSAPEVHHKTQGPSQPCTVQRCVKSF